MNNLPRYVVGRREISGHLCVVDLWTGKSFRPPGNGRIESVEPVVETLNANPNSPNGYIWHGSDGSPYVVIPRDEIDDLRPVEPEQVPDREQVDAEDRGERAKAMMAERLKELDEQIDGLQRERWTCASDLAAATCPFTVGDIVQVGMRHFMRVERITPDIDGANVEWEASGNCVTPNGDDLSGRTSISQRQWVELNKPVGKPPEAPATLWMINRPNSQG